MKNKESRKEYGIRTMGIQTLIVIAFSIISVCIMFTLGVAFYIRFSEFYNEKVTVSTQKLMEQTTERLEDYLSNMRSISNTAYYYVVKERDITAADSEIKDGLNLIYENNKESLRSIAIYNDSGSLICSEPVVSQKEDPDVTNQNWYMQAVSKVENLHFSLPHIQNLFDDGTMRYYWVISLSRAVELTSDGDSKQGVLLVDMDYSEIARMMKQINTSADGTYYYLCSNDGQIVYHTKQVQIDKGLYHENSVSEAGYKDGIYDEKFDGQHRKVIVSTISYTGWKLIGVIPYDTLTNDMIDMRYFIMLAIVLMLMMQIIINRIVANRISKPIHMLNESVIRYEAGQKPDIYIGGSREVRHLADSIQKSYEENDLLMKEVVSTERQKQKSELDALQSQINPHFLYNTLESITWMIEGERNDEAVYMITQLAKLFRISLSKGHTVISISDELQHARSYMGIQKIRYKSSFEVSFNIDPQIINCCSAKLILQPILENAINYGVGAMDGSGEILVSGVSRYGRIYLIVEDNGIGMCEETVSNLLTDTGRTHAKGSGVGIINVDTRIKLLFGQEYGISVESVPDEGTKVTICMPFVEFNEENRKALENGSFDEAHYD